MTHRDTVIRIDPPRKEAAPSSAYLEFDQNLQQNISNGIKVRHNIAEGNIITIWKDIAAVNSPLIA